MRTIALTGGQAAADPDAAIASLAEACAKAKREDGAGAVILGRSPANPPSQLDWIAVLPSS